MRKSNLFYFFSEAKESLRINRKSAWTSVIAISVCLLLLGSIVLINNILTDSLVKMSKSNQYVAYVDETLSEKNARNLYDRIIAIDNVEEATFTSKEQAKNNFAAMIESDTVSSLPSGIFRDRYNLSFRDVDKISETLDQLLQIKGISKISGSTWVSSEIRSLENGMNLVAFCVCVLFCVVSFLIISNTIAASMQHKVQEVHIMRLCGVSEYHIQMPIVIESVIISLRAILISFLSLFALYHVFLGRVKGNGLTMMFSASPFGSYAIELLGIFLLVAFGCTITAVILSCGKTKTRKSEKIKGEKHGNR